MRQSISKLKSSLRKRHSVLKEQVNDILEENAFSKENPCMDRDHQRNYNQSSNERKNATSCVDGEEEYEILEREILPKKIICPDCGGITLEGLEFCDKCGGELINMDM